MTVHKRFEVLGREWCYSKPVAETVADWQDIHSAFEVPNAETRSIQIKSKLFYPAIYHLGFGSISEDVVWKECNRALDLAVDYFTGKWWTVEEIDKLPPELLQRMHLSRPTTGVSVARETRLDEISKRMDKDREDRELVWYDVLTSALFFGGLLGRWNELAAICAWFDKSIEPEYQAGTVEDEYMQLFICIAGSLSPQPMIGADELIATIKKCRSKRPRLLCAAWEAANTGDQAAFDKAFKESVNHFLSKPANGQVYDWVAIPQSVVLFIAEYRGLKCPSLSEKQQAVIVTRQSAGISR